MKKAGKVLLAIISILIVTGLLCLGQYMVYPTKTYFSETTPGYLVNRQGEELIYTKITAEVRGRWEHYLFRTEKEGTLCEIFVEGYNVTGGSFLSTAYWDKHAAGSAAESRDTGQKNEIRFYYMTRKCETVILGIQNAVDIPGNDIPEPSENAITLFVLSADTPEAAQNVVKEAAEDSSQLREYVERYGFLL